MIKHRIIFQLTSENLYPCVGRPVSKQFTIFQSKPIKFQKTYLQASKKTHLGTFLQAVHRLNVVRSLLLLKLCWFKRYLTLDPECIHMGLLNKLTNYFRMQKSFTISYSKYTLISQFYCYLTQFPQALLGEIISHRKGTLSQGEQG